MLTAMKPLISPIRGLRDASGNPVLDVFERQGEPIAVRYLCEGGVRSLFGRDFPYLTPIKIELVANEVNKVTAKEIMEFSVDSS